MGLAFAWTKRPLLTFLCKIKKPAFRAVSSVSLKTKFRTVIISARRGMIMCWYLGSAPRVTFYWNNLLTVSQNVAEPAQKENSLGWNLSSTKLCDFGDPGPPLNLIIRFLTCERGKAEVPIQQRPVLRMRWAVLQMRKTRLSELLKWPGWGLNSVCLPPKPTPDIYTVAVR